MVHILLLLNAAMGQQMITKKDKPMKTKRYSARVSWLSQKEFPSHIFDATEAYATICDETNGSVFQHKHGVHQFLVLHNEDGTKRLRAEYANNDESESSYEKFSEKEKEFSDIRFTYLEYENPSTDICEIDAFQKVPKHRGPTYAQHFKLSRDITQSSLLEGVNEVNDKYVRWKNHIPEMSFVPTANCFVFAHKLGKHFSDNLACEKWWTNGKIQSVYKNFHFLLNGAGDGDVESFVKTIKKAPKAIWKKMEPSFMEFATNVKNGWKKLRLETSRIIEEYKEVQKEKALEQERIEEERKMEKAAKQKRLEETASTASMEESVDMEELKVIFKKFKADLNQMIEQKRTQARTPMLVDPARKL